MKTELFIDWKIFTEIMEDHESNVIKWTEALYPAFRLFTQRLDTFKSKKWPVGLTQKTDKLSEAGFFYTGLADKVICYYCGGRINQWISEDDPWLEHMKHFSSCAFFSTYET